jgi:5'-3' exonuclease
MREYTLLIDGNYFIFSRLFVLPRPKQIPGLDTIKFMDTEKEKAILMRKLCIDFASEIRKLKNITKRIVFTLDSKSWRKDLFPEADYKGNREEDPTINWPNVSEIMKEFTDLLSKQGVIVQRIAGSEGDDLVFAWTTYLNANNESCIIWSGDSDLMQLVNYNRSTNSFTLWYDNTRGTLGVYPGFNKWLETKEGKDDETIDIFSESTRFYIGDQIKDELKNFIQKGGLDVKDVYCDEYVFQKILTGDKGDHITSVLEVPTKSGKLTKDGKPRVNRVNETKAKSVLDSFKKRHRRFSSIYLFEDEYKEEICQLVAREMKVTGKKDEIKKKLELNTNLILLHVSTIPEAIQKTMFDKIKNDYEMITDLEITNLIDKDRILKGTKYLTVAGKNNDAPSKGAIGLF